MLSEFYFNKGECALLNNVHNVHLKKIAIKLETVCFICCNNVLYYYLIIFIMGTENLTIDHSKYDLFLESRDLLIGEAYAVRSAASKKWDKAYDSGDEATVKEMSQTIKELDEKANKEKLHAVLDAHGYSPTTELVVLQPLKTIGWGKHGSTLGGIRQQTVNSGDQITLKVEDLQLSGGNNIYNVYHILPGTKGMQKAKLLTIGQLEDQIPSGVETKEPSIAPLVETLRGKLNKILSQKGSVLGVVRAEAHYGGDCDFIVSIPSRGEEIVIPPGTYWYDVEGYFKNIGQNDIGYHGGTAEVELDEEGIAKLKKLAEQEE